MGVITKTLYETDFVEWTAQTAGLLRAGRLSEADLEKIYERAVRDALFETGLTEKRWELNLPAKCPYELIDFYTYPDILVICGRPQLDGDQRDIVLNPILTAEVLSEPTQDYDQGEKFQRYQNLRSLREYLTVAQDAPRVEHWTRQPDGQWLFADSEGMDANIQLASIDCVLPLSEIYDRILCDGPPGLSPYFSW